MTAATVLNSQQNLNAQVTCNDLTEPVLLKAEIGERLSELFEIDLVIQTETAPTIADLINKTLSIDLAYKANPEQDGASTYRYFFGIIVEASFDLNPDIGTDQYAVYLKVRPTLYKLSLNRRYRIFQNKTSLAIIDTILNENGITNIKKSLTTAGQSLREYCVQYEESDFEFISRLMEEEGIYYYFEHSKTADTFVMAENSIGATKLVDQLKNLTHYVDYNMDIHSIYNVRLSEKLGIKNVKTMSFNEQSAKTLTGNTQGSITSNIGTVEEYSYKFMDTGSGNSISKRILEVDNSVHKTLEFKSFFPEIYAGCIVTTTGSKSTSLNGDFFVKGVHHVINQVPERHGTSFENVPFYENSVVATGNDIAYKPPYVHMKKRIYGAQTAIVTGAQGEEISCDSAGIKVKVRFHWDSAQTQEGAAEDKGQGNNTSCFIRVAQAWAGGGYGAFVIPRVGMEVLVTFVNGDPDQPIISGCLYNGVNTPPGNYQQSKKTVSSFYTSSSMSQQGVIAYNEVRFDDNAGSEEIYIHAQKDMNTVIENNETRLLSGSSGTGTATDSLTIKQGNKIVTLNQGNFDITLDQGNNTITLRNGNQTVTLSSGNLKIDVTGNIDISANNITMNATTQLAINVGTTITTFTPASISHTTQAFTLTSSGAVDMSAGGALNATAGAALSMSAGAAASFTGTGAVAITGGAATSISSIGPLTLKGTPVLVG